MSRPSRADAEFTEFVAGRADQLYRSAYLLTGGPHAAEDLVQTALAKAYAAWWRVSRAEDPVAYVHRMLVNAFLSDRRRRSSRELPVAEPTRSSSVDDDPATRLALLGALRELGPLDRAVVVLRYWDDQSVAQTAAQLGLSQSAVKNRSLRALAVLRERLGTPTHLSDDIPGSGS
jgi:RNA polymerase sigma-70 factor (sigma-E family)